MCPESDFARRAELPRGKPLVCEVAFGFRAIENWEARKLEDRRIPGFGHHKAWLQCPLPNKIAGSEFRVVGRPTGPYHDWCNFWIGDDGVETRDLGTF
jgi:hypothetical protein